MAERYKGLKIGSLFDYITPERFRTATLNQRLNVEPGVTEIPVELQLKPRMRELLSFKLPWDGVMYGFARDKDEIKERLGVKEAIKTAYIVDWDDKFLLMFELEDNIDFPVLFVKTEDVVGLLENCWRVFEHRISK